MIHNLYFLNNCYFYKGYEGENIFIFKYKDKIFFCTRHGLNDISKCRDLYNELNGEQNLSLYFREEDMYAFSCIELYLVHPKLSISNKECFEKLIIVQSVWNLDSNNNIYHENLSTTKFYKYNKVHQLVEFVKENDMLSIDTLNNENSYYVSNSNISINDSNSY